MRFKRVRWAAMEFLLKAQKRMRRKLIIEQLLLLFLRCLLVFLLGLLLARFLGFDPLDGRETPPTPTSSSSTTRRAWATAAAATTADRPTPFGEAKKRTSPSRSPRPPPRRPRRRRSTC